MVLHKFVGRAAAALALLAALALPAAAATPIPAGTTLAPDPAVKRGTLANGLRYAVMRNASPAGMISIRLAMDVGSYDEADSERGYAHFIEHMAFRSSRDAPEGTFGNHFASLGVALGRDQNAVTGMRSTNYSVDLPAGGIAGVKSVLGWMRGAADGILFAQAGVDLERGVVLAERQARDGPLAVAQLRTARFQGPGMRSVERDPGGTEASLRAATPAALKAFYDRWYRPENGVLVIVGDAPAAELEQAIQAAFGDWAGRGPAGVRPPASSAAPARGLDALSQSDPALPWAISACRLTAPDLDRSQPLERMRRDLVSQLWTAILDKRLIHLVAAENSALVHASTVVNRDNPDAIVGCLTLLPAGDQWRPALAAAQAELRRFAQAGPTAQELATAIEDVRSQLRAALYQGGTRLTSSLSDGIAQAELDRRSFQDPAQAARTLELLVDGMTPDDIRAAFGANWSGAGPLIAAIAERAPPREELLAAWTANEQVAPLAAYADRASSTWAYGRFGKKGKVKRRERFTNPEFARFTFGNGVVLTFKHTDLREQGAEIRVRFGPGERALQPSTRLSAALAAGTFPMGGLGRMDFEQIASAFNNTNWMFTLDIDTDAYTIRSSTMSPQVEQQMQLLAAYMTDPGFRSLMGDKLPTAIDFVYRSFRTNPSVVAADALEQRLYPDKLSLPPRETLSAFSVADFERLLRPALTAGPIEVTIVGDIDEAEAIKVVATSFGALPRRAPARPPAGEGPFRRFPATLPTIVEARHDGPAEKAAALLMWPLYVATPERRSEEYAITLVAAVFEARLLQRVRFAMGKVYSPTVSSVMPDFADQGYLAAGMEATPADIGEIVAAARTIAAELAAGAITQAEIDTARDPLIAARLQAQNRNEAWAGVLSAALRHPEALDELLQFEQMMRALTLDDVHRAAATWLAGAPMVATALPGQRTASRD